MTHSLDFVPLEMCGPCTQWQKTVYYSRQDVIIVEMMKKNRNASLRCLQFFCFAKSALMLPSMYSTALVKLGIILVLHSQPLLTHAHQKARLIWCKKYRLSDFRRWLFSDECPFPFPRVTNSSLRTDSSPLEREDIKPSFVTLHSCIFGRCVGFYVGTTHCSTKQHHSDEYHAC